MFSNRIINKKYVVCIISVLIFKKKFQKYHAHEGIFQKGLGILLMLKLKLYEHKPK